MALHAEPLAESVEHRVDVGVDPRLAKVWSTRDKIVQAMPRRTRRPRLGLFSSATVSTSAVRSVGEQRLDPRPNGAGAGLRLEPGPAMGRSAAGFVRAISNASQCRSKPRYIVRLKKPAA